MMNLHELIELNRSYRRFYQDEIIPENLIIDWIDLTRKVASGRNAQTLKYTYACSTEATSSIFPLLAWAGYLKDWSGPAKGEQPAAYIIMVHDTSIAPQYFCDDGIAAQTILLAATEQGFGGCMIASFQKKELSELLELPEQLKPIMVIALGKPKEQVVLVDLKDRNYQYYRDDQGVHYVPKRSLKEILIK